MKKNQKNTDNTNFEKNEIFQMDNDLKQWRQDGKHLPDFLKDFHDQKDFINFLFKSTDLDKSSPLKNIDTIQAHVFTIDLLLFRLASYGYTIQKNKSKQNFNDLKKDIELYNKQRTNNFNQLLKKTVNN